MSLKVSSSLRGIVLGCFDRSVQSIVSAGDNPQNHPGRDSKSRRAFGRVKHPKPSAGAGSNVDQSPAGFDSFDNQVNSVGDAIEHTRDCLGDVPVFVVDERDDLDRRAAVYVFSVRVGLFGDGFHFGFDAIESSASMER
jgi:hypothetical protein